MNHLLARGENPRFIRVLDVRAPTRVDLTTGLATQVDFRICDISDEQAVRSAFEAPWPQSRSEKEGEEGDRDDGNENVNKSTELPELTVFHTAANIRFYERVWWLVPLSTAVNVRGTQHLLDAARSVGASIFVSTSSGSICIRRSRFLLWPWETEPPYFVQEINDSDDLIPKQHNHFFSNYAYTKRLGEALVRGADKTPSSGGRVLRTGSLRPGNGVYGPGGDVLLGAALVREFNPTWIGNIVQNFVYVENASLAHLCYEERLLSSSSADKVSGKAYCIADDGPPPTYGDVYHALSVLTEGRVFFPELSATIMFVISHVIEALYLARQYLLRMPLPKFFQPLVRIIAPQLPGDMLNLQPSLFALVGVHTLFDDSNARRELGYKPQWTTLQGVCALVADFESNGRVAEARQRSGGGIGLGLGMTGLWRPRRVPTPKPKDVSIDLDFQAVSGVQHKVE